MGSMINYPIFATFGYGLSAALVMNFVRPALPGPGVNELLRYLVTGAAVTVLGESLFSFGTWTLPDDDTTLIKPST